MFPLLLGHTGADITKSLKWAAKDIYEQEEFNSTATKKEKKEL